MRGLLVAEWWRIFVKSTLNDPSGSVSLYSIEASPNAKLQNILMFFFQTRHGSIWLLAKLHLWKPVKAVNLSKSLSYIPTSESQIYRDFLRFSLKSFSLHYFRNMLWRCSLLNPHTDAFYAILMKLTPSSVCSPQLITLSGSSFKSSTNKTVTAKLLSGLLNYWTIACK